MTFHPETGLVYIPALDLRFDFAQDNAFKHSKEDWNTGIDFRESAPPADPEEMIDNLKEIKGFVSAWDPKTQKEYGGCNTLQRGMAACYPLQETLFQGRADGYFAAYAADSGQLLWESPTHVGSWQLQFRILSTENNTSPSSLAGEEPTASRLALQDIRVMYSARAEYLLISWAGT